MLDLSPLGLAEPPFSLSPDPRFFFLSAQHKTALAKITYTAEQRQGLSVVYGDIGVGKTTIARRIYQIYNDDPAYETAYLPMPIFPSEFQFLKAVCSEFGLPPRRSKYAQIEHFNAYLVDIWEQGKNAVVIIDEAQSLVGQQFELIRQMLNFESNSQKLVQVILIGQNELRNKFRRKRSLQSRIATRSTIEPLDMQDTRNMINFRVMVAGRQELLFTEDAFQLIYDYSRGMPRDVCVVGLNVLPLALVEGVHAIDADLIRQAIAEIGED
ncbi:MAG: AAA family ATPase [Chloroflexota bacterium]|nr:AAA family ATPase [Chloroflexota bacterium]